MKTKVVEIVRNKIELINHEEYLQVNVYSKLPENLAEYVKFIIFFTLFIAIYILDQYYLFNLINLNSSFFISILTRGRLTFLEIFVGISTYSMIFKIRNHYLIKNNPVDIINTFNLSMDSVNKDIIDPSENIIQIKNVGFFHSNDQQYLESLKVGTPSDGHEFATDGISYVKNQLKSTIVDKLIVFISIDNEIIPLISYQDFKERHSSNINLDRQLQKFRNYLFRMKPELRATSNMLEYSTCSHGYVSLSL